MKQTDKEFLEIENRKVANLGKAKEMMEFLGIPLIPSNLGHWHEIYAVDLYDIFTDQEKLQVLISKLRNRALW